jgi:hypothetical protein
MIMGDIIMIFPLIVLVLIVILSTSIVVEVKLVDMDYTLLMPHTVVHLEIGRRSMGLPVIVPIQQVITAIVDRLIVLAITAMEDQLLV